MRKSRTSLIQLLAILLSCGCSTVTPIDEMPMYGGIHTDPWLQETNPKFIENATKTSGTREQASEDAAQRGWEFYYRGDLSTAMKRFNQAWLLNTNNADAYWGFGIIAGDQAERSDTEHKLRESITFLETANEKCPKNAAILTDLAISHMMLGAAVLKRQHRPGGDDEFAKAQSLFENAMAIEPTYALLYANWSFLEFYRLDYFGAKERLDKAVSLGFTPTPDYLKDLNRLKDKMKE